MRPREPITSGCELTFSESAKEDILELFGKAIDSEGFIVEKETPEQRVLTPKGEEIHITEWGGIIKGGKTGHEQFIKSDSFTLLNLAKQIR